MTVLHCCDNINITNGTTSVMFGRHRYEVNVVFCKECGSQKATSHIKHIKEGKYDDVRQPIPGRAGRATAAG